MATLYEDRHVVCDDDSITIRGYYLPVGGNKRIPYADILGVREVPLGLFTGRLRIWGASVPTRFFHFDLRRPKKKRGISIDKGGLVRAVVTLEDPDRVLSILRERARPA